MLLVGKRTTGRITTTANGIIYIAHRLLILLSIALTCNICYGFSIKRQQSPSTSASASASASARIFWKSPYHNQRKDSLDHPVPAIPTTLTMSSTNLRSSNQNNNNNNNNDYTSTISDWVIENLETNNTSITWSSTTTAGENDTIPENGLIIGNVIIFAAGTTSSTKTTTTTTITITITDSQSETHNHQEDKTILKPIKLLVGRNGWGTGVHATTRLCIEFLCTYLQDYNNKNPTNKNELVVLDYGCGSGILSITSLHMGAKQCIGVDVEAEALVTAERNVVLNGYNAHNNNNDSNNYKQFIPYHTREVLPYSISSDTNGGVDICVANILIGQLVRSSMIIAIVTNVKPGGIICFSGIRPNEIQSLKDAYSNYIETWLDNDYYSELDSKNCAGSIESYGYDCGIWCRIVGQTKLVSDTDSSSTYNDVILSMSESAVS